MSGTTGAEAAEAAREEEQRKLRNLLISILDTLPRGPSDRDTLAEKAMVAYLLTYASKDYDVVGVVRRSSTVNFERIAHIQDRLTLVPGDLLDQGSLLNIVAEQRPSEVYNLAAQSFVMTSFSQPVLTGDVTALGVTRILEAIRIVDPDIRFYQASSSEMFGIRRNQRSARTMLCSISSIVMISMSQPTSLLARRTFWPRRPIASDS